MTTRRQPERRHRAGEVKSSRAALLWQKPILKVLVFLENLRSKPQLHGDAWVARMRAHYSERVYAMLQSAPLSAAPQAEQIRERLARALKDA